MAYCWFRDGLLAVAVVRVNQRTVLVNPDSAGGLVLVVWVCLRGCAAVISAMIWTGRWLS
jgi:hypothetical protein